MKRASLVAVSLCVLAAAQAARAEPPMKSPTKPADAPVIASVTTPTPVPVETAAEAAPSKPTPPPAITLVVKIDLTNQRLTVSEGGKVKYTWSISSGAEGFNTPVGTFQPEWMSKLWFSKKYDNAPMPHAVFFKNAPAAHSARACVSLRMTRRSTQPPEPLAGRRALMSYPVRRPSFLASPSRRVTTDRPSCQTAKRLRSR